MITKPLVTIVVPVLNEEHTVTSVLRSLARQDRISDCQVIVIDGMSHDDTVAVASSFPFVQVASCLPGRARQMNFGARAALAPVLWFLHADSTLPTPNCIGALLAALADESVAGGAFRFHLRGGDIYYRLINGLVNLRTRLFRRCYGDQGIFVRTELFHGLGGIRDIESCEDLDLVLRVRKAGRFAFLGETVETSARTWHRDGKLQTTLWHLRQLALFEWRRRLGTLQVREEQGEAEPEQVSGATTQGGKEVPTESAAN